MDRIVLDQKGSIGKEIFIEGPPLEALRFQGAREGSIVTLTDVEGNDFRGRVTRLSTEGASVLIFDLFPSSTESPLEIVLLQALPEKERMELIIQKGTELGVSMIIPFKSETIDLPQGKGEEAEEGPPMATRCHQGNAAIQKGQGPSGERVLFVHGGPGILRRGESKDHPLGKERRASQNGSQPTSSPEDLCHGGSGGRVYGRRGKTGAGERVYCREIGPADLEDRNSGHHSGGNPPICAGRSGLVRWGQGRGERRLLTNRRNRGKVGEHHGVTAGRA